MPKPSSRTPDYNLNILDKDTGLKGKAGAAWINEDGSINLKLDPWVVLKGNGHGQSLHLTLFKFETKEEREAKFAKRDAESKANRPPTDYGLEDDVPF